MAVKGLTPPNNPTSLVVSGILNSPKQSDYIGDLWSSHLQLLLLLLQPEDLMVAKNMQQMSANHVGSRQDFFPSALAGVVYHD